MKPLLLSILLTSCKAIPNCTVDDCATAGLQLIAAPVTLVKIIADGSQPEQNVGASSQPKIKPAK